MIRLIVNADDLGLASEIDDGIFDSVARGIVTSASLLVGGRTFEALGARLKTSPLGLGIHLAAVGGLPAVAERSRISRVAPNGVLPASWQSLTRLLLSRPAVAAEVLAEFEAQIARARDLQIPIDHVDGHQHLHVWPGLFRGVVDLCRRFGIRGIRIPDERLAWSALARPARAAITLPLTLLAARARRSSDGFAAPRFWGLFAGGQLDRPTLLRLLDALPDGDHEIGCHPGQGVTGVPEDPGWKYRWDAEHVALCDPEVRALVERRQIRLCRYADLAAA